jgi:hypothetical protein
LFPHTTQEIKAAFKSPIDTKTARDISPAGQNYNYDYNDEGQGLVDTKLSCMLTALFRFLHAGVYHRSVREG